MITYALVIQWILENRRGKAFEGYSANKIYHQLQNAISEGVFKIQFEDGVIVGIVCGRKLDNKTVFIDDVLTTKAGVIKDFMQTFVKLFPNCVIKGIAHGRERIFRNPKRVIDLL